MDGSLVGISAGLSREGRIILFGSRILTLVEQTYSQAAHESFAITWACDYFHIYLFVAPFIVTDHNDLQ